MISAIDTGLLLGRVQNGRCQLHCFVHRGYTAENGHHADGFSDFLVRGTGFLGVAHRQADLRFGLGTVHSQTRQRQQQRMRQLVAALRRIDEDDYGYCEDCGEPVNPRRLEIDPATLFCLECASARE